MPEDPGVIAFNGVLARAYFLLEDYRRSQQVAEKVLEAAERLELLPVIADALVTRGMGHSQLGRMYEGVGALEAGLRLAESQGFNATMIRARVNIGGTLWFRDPRAALAATVPGLELARRLGRRSEEIILSTNGAYASLRLGEWAFRQRLEELLGVDLEASDRLQVLAPLVHFRALQGELGLTDLADLDAFANAETDAQNKADRHRARAAAALADGRLDDVWTESLEAADASVVNGPAPLAVAAHAAIWMGDRSRVADALERHLATNQHGAAIEAERAGMRAAIAALAGREQEAVVGFRDTLARWRDLGCDFDFALTAIDAAALGLAGGELAASIDQARSILGRLRARPILGRLDEALAIRPAPVSAPRPGANQEVSVEGRVGAQSVTAG
jgi:hypothetical protein